MPYSMLLVGQAPAVQPYHTVPPDQVPPNTHITGINPEAVKWGVDRYDRLLCPGLQPGSPSQTPGGLGQRYWSVSEVTWPPQLELRRWRSSGPSSVMHQTTHQIGSPPVILLPCTHALQHVARGQAPAVQPYHTVPPDQVPPNTHQTTHQIGSPPVILLPCTHALQHVARGQATAVQPYHTVPPDQVPPNTHQTTHQIGSPPDILHTCPTAC